MINQKGQALIMVLVFLLVGTMVIMPMLELAFSCSKLVQANGRMLDGYYTADAGVQYQLSVIRNITDDSVPPDYIVYINNMTATASVARTGSSGNGTQKVVYYTITSNSSGLDGRHATTLTANVTQKRGTSSPPYPISFQVQRK